MSQTPQAELSLGKQLVCKVIDFKIPFGLLSFVKSASLPLLLLFHCVGPEISSSLQD